MIAPCSKNLEESDLPPEFCPPATRLVSSEVLSTRSSFSPLAQVLITSISSPLCAMAALHVQLKSNPPGFTVLQAEVSDMNFR